MAADALSNLALPGVIGGTLIVVGEDYGEGASVIQELSHAFALKPAIWLLDPRPDLPTIVNMVEKSFELSEASNTPVMMELRSRACHVFGSFEAKDNLAAPKSVRNKFAEPAPFNYARLAHPPVTFLQEGDKVNRRLPLAREFIARHGLNEVMGPETGEIGIITQGGLFDGLNDRLADAGLSDAYGALGLPTLVLNVTHPLLPDQIVDFARGKKAVLIVEEGAPEYIELAVGKILRQADLQTRIHGKDMLPMAGEYTGVGHAGKAPLHRDGRWRILAQRASCRGGGIGVQPRRFRAGGDEQRLFQRHGRAGPALEPAQGHRAGPRVRHGEGAAQHGRAVDPARRQRPRGEPGAGAARGANDEGDGAEGIASTHRSYTVGEKSAMATGGSTPRP